MQNFSIIIPTLNEAENIVPLIEGISTMADLSNLRPELIFVDDGSIDTTCQQILAYKGNLEVRLHQRVGVKGLAGAVVAGGKLAKYDNLVIMDGDLSHPPEIIPQLILPLFLNEKDMVIGSRYTEGGSTPDWPFLRKLGSRLATLPAHFLTGVEDPLAGFFSIRKKLLVKIDPDICGFKIGFELLRRFGREIRDAEVPIRFTHRSRGKSKMKFPILAHYFLQLLEGIGINLQVGRRPLILLIGFLGLLLDTGLLTLLRNGNLDLVSSHIVSFLVIAHICFFAGLPHLLRIKRLPSLKVALPAYRHFFMVSVLGLFLRGGLLSILLNQQVMQATVLNVLGLSTFFVWLAFASTLQTGSKATSVRPTFRILAITIIFYSVFVRLFYLGTTELLQEEAYYWNYARHLSPGYLDHPPFVATLIWLGTKLLGHTEMGVRLGAFCCWFATACFSYALTRAMFTAKAAINAVLLIATLPIFFASSLIMTPDAPLITCWAATLFFLHQALLKDHKLSWILAGVFFGLGLISKYTIVFLAPATLLFILIDPASRRWLWSPMPYLAALIALIFFSPVIWWNFENNWASFLFQSHGRIVDESMFSTHVLLGSLILLLTPAGLIAAISALTPNRKTFGTSPQTSIKAARRYCFLLTMTLTPLLVFLFFSLTKEVKINWTGPIWLAAIPFIAHSILVFENQTTNIDSDETKKKLNQIFLSGWRITFVSLIFIYGATLHFLGIGLPGIPYPTNTILLGWNDLALQVEESVQYCEKIKGKRPIIVGMDRYRIASGFSFYSIKLMNNNPSNLTSDLPPVTGRHIFGLRSLMFRYWHPPQLFSQQDILAISQSRIGLHPDYFRHKVRKMGNIKEISIQKHGKTVAKYYFRLLQSYVPPASKKVAIHHTHSPTG